MKDLSKAIAERKERLAQIDAQIKRGDELITHLRAVAKTGTNVRHTSTELTPEQIAKAEANKGKHIYWYSHPLCNIE